MSTGLDLFASLHRIVREAVEILAGATRGSLLLQEGDRMILRAAVGFEGAQSRRLPIPSDAGPASALPLLSPTASARVIPAEAWYRAHLPGAPARSGLSAGAVVVVTPVCAHEQPIGVLAVEQAAEDAPAGERWERLRALADSAGAAIRRRELYDDKARSAHEVRLLEEVLNAVAEQASPHELIEIISSGIKSLQLGPQWSAVTLVMLDEAARERAPTSEPVDGRALRVYRVPRRAPTAYWNNMRDGALVAGRNLGIHVEYRLGDDEAGQQAVLAEAVRRGVHGIAVAPMNPDGIEPAIRAAAEAGIPVLTLDTPPAQGSRALVYIGTDNIAAGRLAGDMMRRLLPGGGTVAAQLASLRAENGRERVDGFGAAVAGAAIAVEPPSENQFDTSRGVRLAVEALQRDGIAGAFGACAENGPCFGLAARAAGRTGDLKIVAFDLVAETIAMIREGTVHAAVVQREHDMGYRAVQVLHAMASNGVEATLAELPAPGARGPLRFIDTGVDLVTLEDTPWSRSLADHLTLDTNRKAARRRGVASGGSPIELVVIGMDAEEEGFVEERAPFDPASLVARVLSDGRSRVVDAASGDLDDAPDVGEARQRGVRTLVGVPLLARGAALGVLVLASERRAACSPGDIAVIERVADTMAVAIENARLLQRITERTQALEQANRQQESLLDTILALSSPVVPIARDILVMPIVGVMDRQRSGRFIESMLREIAERKARVVLVDVTGMAVVDASAADHLATAARAARLLGAEVVLVGITPTAAKLMVEQRLDLGSVVTRSTLELGFAHALSATGGRVVYPRS